MTRKFELIINGTAVNGHLGTPPKPVVIPEGITKISHGAFMGSSVERIQLPSTLKEIKDMAFQNCHITDLTLPENLEYIGNSAFNHNNLRHIIIPPSVKTIKQLAFSSNKLTGVEMKGVVSKLLSGAFSYNRLRHVSLRSRHQASKSSYAFSGNPLESLEILGDKTYCAYYNSPMGDLRLVDGNTGEIYNLAFKKLKSGLIEAVAKYVIGADATELLTITDSELCIDNVWVDFPEELEPFVLGKLSGKW